MVISSLLVTLLVVIATTIVAASHLIRLIARLIGFRLKDICKQRRELIYERSLVEEERLAETDNVATSADDDWEKIGKRGDTISSPKLGRDKSWKGIIGFFHPFCNAGGGGERVLWAAIAASQQRWPNAICLVYTGDHEVTKEQMLKRVEDRFDIRLHSPTVVFLYLTTRHYVLASTWPKFTLAGQSLGSLLMAWDAFNLMVPDIFIDTMGYAFASGLCKLLFPKIPTGSYVHYPTISTDMLSSLDAPASEGRGVNAGLGKGLRGTVKRRYWLAFAALYSRVGGSLDVVMANGTWTGAHIRSLWGEARTKKRFKYPVDIVFPPCAVEDMSQQITVDETSETKRKPTIIYIAQFRPEKNHQLILRSFADFLQSLESSPSNVAQKPDLLLIGSVRDSADETYIYSLRLLVNELHITQSVTFLLNAPWSRILTELQTCSVGVNGMWNEHFGIGVVEYQAAGLISVVHDSGGPKWDIVIDQGDGPTGFHATSQSEFAEAFAKALDLDTKTALAMRLRARRSAMRFSETAFQETWLKHMERLVSLCP